MVALHSLFAHGPTGVLSRWGGSHYFQNCHQLSYNNYSNNEINIIDIFFIFIVLSNSYFYHHIPITNKNIHENKTFLYENLRYGIKSKCEWASYWIPWWQRLWSPLWLKKLSARKANNGLSLMLICTRGYIKNRIWIKIHRRYPTIHRSISKSLQLFKIFPLMFNTLFLK